MRIPGRHRDLPLHRRSQGLLTEDALATFVMLIKQKKKAGG